jgi:hypothetical protein
MDCSLAAPASSGVAVMRQESSDVGVGGFLQASALACAHALCLHLACVLLLTQHRGYARLPARHTQSCWYVSKMS